MPKISDYGFNGPLAFSDKFVGVFGGSTQAPTLQQLRDFFGVGTNINTLAQYPLDPANANYGKDGDILLIASTGNLYRRVAGSYPAENVPFMTLQGTRVNDAAVGTDTSWSSDKIKRMLDSTRNAHLTFTADRLTVILTYKTRIAIEELSVNRGSLEFSFRVVKSNAAVVGVYPTFGDVNLAVGQLSSADVAGGFDIEISYTGNAPLTTAVYRSVVI